MSRSLPIGYVDRLMAAYAVLPTGTVSQANVEHDAGCPALAGGDCQCTPNITITTEAALITVDAAGNVFKEKVQ